MRIFPVSDIHLEFAPYPVETFPAADVAIAAGDICIASLLAENRTDPQACSHKKSVARFFGHLIDKYPLTLYILGNHEHYHGELLETKTILTSFFKSEQFFQASAYGTSKGHKLILMDNTVINHDDVCFIGATLWTDFAKCDPLTMQVCQRGMNDFIVVANGGPFRFTPEQAYQLHLETKKFIEDSTAKNTEKKVVVLTHHAPSLLSLDPRFNFENRLNAAFASDVTKLMKPNVKLWVHGHIHCSKDYKIGETRIIANPRGYPIIYGITHHNAEFNKQLVIEV